MKPIVVKLGGSVLTGPCDASAILDILSSYEGPLVVVVSALKGVTDRLIAARDAESDSEYGPSGLVSELSELHAAFVAALAPPEPARSRALARLDELAVELSVLLEGAGGADRRARIASFGERLSAPCVAAALAVLGREAEVLEPGRIGLVAVGPEEDAEADLEVSARNVAHALSGRSATVVPGFYGVGSDGLVRLFGRGGSDYSAAAIAVCLAARSCDLVKDSSGFLTADPGIVPGALPVLSLSYREAAELARGGAKILHPRAVGPLERAGIPLRILGEAGPASATVVGRRPPAKDCVPRAIALGRGPRGTARLTVTGEGSTARAAAAILGVFEERGLAARSFSSGRGAVSFRIVVDASRGAEALRAAHEVLFGGVRAGALTAIGGCETILDSAAGRTTAARGEGTRGGA